VKAKRDEENAPVRWARIHAVEVAAVVLYGEPKIAEPLSVLDKQFAAAADELWIRRLGEKMHPAIRRGCYSLLMFNALPGADDNLKFERIFSNAPIWLLNFAGIEWDAKLLGFKIPKLVGAPALGEEARLDRNHWPFLPEGTTDSGGPCSEPDEPWEHTSARVTQHGGDASEPPLRRQGPSVQIASRRTKRCRRHGGAPGIGAPDGNKSAVKHGLYTEKPSLNADSWRS
jgi:hypothetical protein